MVLEAVLIALSLVVVVSTVLPLLRRDEWWIRVFDFPRGQVTLLGVVLAAVTLLTLEFNLGLRLALSVALVACVAYQVIRMLPYTRIYPKQVHRAGPNPTSGSFSLLIANVLMTNRQADRFVELVRACKPDLFLVVETDAWWEEQLRPLEEQYPETVKYPLDNTYGMLLYSRLPLVNPEVKFLVEDDIPSVHTGVRLAGGKVVQLRFVHPRPPYPKEAKETTDRDAELLIVGREVDGLKEPVVVAGDLNDVAWSHTTHLFQKISGLLDPRVGRGMFNTFSAKNPLLRWPLDHVFHSEHFKLVEIRRLPAFGSDHFPVFVRLSLEAGAALVQEEPRADTGEKEEAREKIQEAIEGE